MKNIYEVLRDKQNAVMRLRIEVDALRLIAPLLADNSADSNQGSQAPQRDGAGRPTLDKNKWPLKVDDAAPNYSDS
jgi:hypothetical protein